jgi:hypothetical protein
MPLVGKRGMRNSCYKSMVILLPLVARSAAMASAPSLRKPATAAFMLPLTNPLGMRTAGSTPRISPALRGGSGTHKGNILSASQLRRKVRRVLRCFVSKEIARARWSLTSFVGRGQCTAHDEPGEHVVGG